MHIIENLHGLQYQISSTHRQQWVSKCDPFTCSINIIRELIGNADSQSRPSPDLLNWKLGVRPHRGDRTKI